MLPRSSLRVPHPTRIEPTVTAQPLRASRCLAVLVFSGEKLETQRADLGGGGVAVHETKIASATVTVDGSLWVGVVITRVRRRPEIEKLLIFLFDPLIGVLFPYIANQ